MELLPKPAKVPTATEIRHVSRRWKDQRSPERNKVWIEPQKHRRVPVVYYLCRNGHLEHPHFVEVLLSSSDGLYLRDVIDRLNSLRGKGMAALYSWSSKRSYKNGFVWHDLSENDFIYPAHGQEYVLKGSELLNALDSSFRSKSDEAISSISEKSSSSETVKSVDEFELQVDKIRNTRNQSWSGIDLHEYKVYSGESSAATIAADASTQTVSHRSCRRGMINELEEDKQSESYHDNEISPPPSESSTETLESLMKSDGKLILRPETGVDVNPTAGSKMKASSVLMQLISCGSISFRDRGPGSYGKEGKENQGFSLFPKLNQKLPRGRDGDDRTDKVLGEGTCVNDVVSGRTRGKKVMVVEDKEYFSGSVIETKKDEFPALKRSNSYNANG